MNQRCTIWASNQPPDTYLFANPQVLPILLLELLGLLRLVLFIPLRSLLLLRHVLVLLLLLLLLELILMLILLQQLSLFPLPRSPLLRLRL